MPLMILGFVFVVGLFIYYLLSTKGSSESKEKKNKSDLKEEENIIFLPNDIEREKKKHNKNKR